MKQLKVRVNKTEGEWEIINQKIKSSGKRDFNTFMQSRLSEIATRFNNSPESITNAAGRRIEKCHYVNPDIYKTLKLISFKMQISESTVVDKLIINPILHP